MIHLDTSFVIEALAAGSPQDHALRRWVLEGERLAMCAIAWAELACGPLEPAHPALLLRLVSDRVPFTGDDAEAAARLFNATGRRRGSLADCMIAACALRAAAPLATTNLPDFRRFEPLGLTLAG